MEDLARKEQINRLKYLLKSGDFSDLVITCGDDTYNVHKAIVCAQSAFFDHAVKSRGVQMFDQYRIDLTGHDPASVKLLIAFFYEAEYEPRLPKETQGRIDVASSKKTKADHQYRFPHTCSQVCKPSSGKSVSQRRVCHHHVCRSDTCKLGCRNFICEECTGIRGWDMLVHAKMFRIASLFAIDGLMTLAHTKLARVGEYFWNHDSFPEAVEYALLSISIDNVGLRNSLSKIIVNHLELLQKPAIAAIMEKHCGFAFHVVKQQAAEVKRFQDQWANHTCGNSDDD